MISEIANRQQKYIEPMMSLTVDFYIRLFIRVKDGAKPCHESIAKYSHVFQCMDCESYYLHPMGIHSIEEVTFDQETGKKKGRRKLQKEDEAQNPTGGHAEEDHNEEEEEEKGTEGKKIRDKYQLP